MSNFAEIPAGEVSVNDRVATMKGGFTVVDVRKTNKLTILKDDEGFIHAYPHDRKVLVRD